jgi:hypothetical protein
MTPGRFEEFTVMSFKTLFIFVPVVALAALTGCKPSCTGLCDDAQDADCHDNDNVSFDHAGCYADCQRQEDMEDDDVDECSDDFDELMACINEQSDICKAFEVDPSTYELEKCNSEYEDYAKCYSEYCDDHEKRDYCS